MNDLLVYVAVAFAAGMAFGMTITASALDRRGMNQPTTPTVVYVNERRNETLEAEGRGCVSVIFMALLVLGVVAALVVLGALGS